MDSAVGPARSVGQNADLRLVRPSRRRSTGRGCSHRPASHDRQVPAREPHRTQEGGDGCPHVYPQWDGGDVLGRHVGGHEHAEGQAPDRSDDAIGVWKRGSAAQNASGTRSRAYASVKGFPIASKPPSTASRTVATGCITFGRVRGTMTHRDPSARSKLKAALIRARCVNACGKLPRASPLGPVCWAYRPRWLAYHLLEEQPGVFESSRICAAGAGERRRRTTP